MRQVLVAMAVLLAACTVTVVSDTSERAGDESTTTTTIPDPPSVEETTTTTSQADIGTRNNPILVGESAQVGDYEIAVLGYQRDATAEVLAYNDFNDPPPDGSVYVLISLEFTYIGDESGDVWLDSTWSGVGDSNVSSEVGDCIAYPDDLFEVGELFPEGTADGNICLTVTEDDVDSLVLILEETFSFDETRFFFVLP